MNTCCCCIKPTHGRRYDFLVRIYLISMGRWQSGVAFVRLNTTEVLLVLQICLFGSQDYEQDADSGSVSTVRVPKIGMCRLGIDRRRSMEQRLMRRGNQYNLVHFTSANLCQRRRPHAPPLTDIKYSTTMGLFSLGHPDQARCD